MSSKLKTIQINTISLHFKTLINFIFGSTTFRVGLDETNI